MALLLGSFTDWQEVIISHQRTELEDMPLSRHPHSFHPTPHPHPYPPPSCYAFQEALSVKETMEALGLELEDEGLEMLR